MLLLVGFLRLLMANIIKSSLIVTKCNRLDLVKIELEIFM